MALLELRGVTVRFGGHLAVDQVDLSVEAGEIVGLIGPNGAGKTTTFNVITGLQPPSGGRVLLADTDISRSKAHKRARLGIARTFQRIEVFGSLTAHENVLLAVELRRRRSRGRSAEASGLADLVGVAQGASPADEAAALLTFVGADSVADTRADELPTGLARLVELARALATHPRVLLLDEPASGQDDAETEAFGTLLTRLAGSGMGVLLVEHDVPLVMRLCTRVYVLDFGRVLANGSPIEIQKDQAVLDAYLGAGAVTEQLAEDLGDDLAPEAVVDGPS